MTKKQKAQAEAKAILLESYIKPSSKLLIVIKSVSASGMSRRMQVLVDYCNISRLVADLCGLTMNEKGIRVDGCGMDMTFWLADCITNALYGQDKPKELTGNGGSCLAWSSV